VVLAKKPVKSGFERPFLKKTHENQAFSVDFPFTSPMPSLMIEIVPQRRSLDRAAGNCSMFGVAVTPRENQEEREWRIKE
jgi:hypothetical protein